MVDLIQIKKPCSGGLLFRVINPMGVKGGRGSKIPYEVHGFQRSNKSKVSTISKVLGRQGFPREVMASRV